MSAGDTHLPGAIPARPPAAAMPATTCLRPSQVPPVGADPRVGYDTKAIDACQTLESITSGAQRQPGLPRVAAAARVQGAS